MSPAHNGDRRSNSRDQTTSRGSAIRSTSSRRQAKVSDSLGRFFKAEAFLKMTKNKKDQTKLE